MRHSVDAYLFPGIFAPVLSLEELSSRLDPETGHATFDLPDSAPGPDVQLEHSQAHAADLRFVDVLPARDREIVRRVFWVRISEERDRSFRQRDRRIRERDR